MKRFVAGADRGQSTLLPECLDDFIDEGDPVRMIDVFVDTLDLAEMSFEGVDPAATGRPSYHPSVLLKLYIYGYLNRAEAIQNLESDDNFAEMNLIQLFDLRDEALDKLARSLLKRLSSGHAIVLLTITKLVARVDEKTLVLLESHLHPPLLSALIRSLSSLLSSRNAIAIIATHSPVVLQGIPRSCVLKITRSGLSSEWRRPEVETFGENVGSLTREVFGLEVAKSGFNALLLSEAERAKTYEQVIAAFNEQLGFEGERSCDRSCIGPSGNRLMKMLALPKVDFSTALTEAISGIGSAAVRLAYTTAFTDPQAVETNYADCATAATLFAQPRVTTMDDPVVHGAPQIRSDKALHPVFRPRRQAGQTYVRSHQGGSRRKMCHLRRRWSRPDIGPLFTKGKLSSLCGYADEPGPLSEKLNAFADVRERQTLHPYFDHERFFIDKWIHARVIPTTPTLLQRARDGSVHHPEQELERRCRRAAGEYRPH